MNAFSRTILMVAPVALVALALGLRDAQAIERDPDSETETDADSTPSARRAELRASAPAPVDAPQLRNVEPRTRVYLDGAFAQTGDLSALPDIAGSGRNLRLALGGSLRWRRFQFDLELPASQATTLDLVAPNPNILIYMEDQHQTALSIGDLRTGAQWTDALPIDALNLVGGLGLRVRLPTHTTRFQFHDIAGALGTYALPYYFHIEPTALLGGSLGPVSFVTNQGALMLMGPNGTVEGLPVVVPNIYFWDAHYAVAWRIIDLISASCEVNTTIQLNHVDGIDFRKLNDVRAVSVIPGLQVHLGRYRIDAAARLGLTRGAELLGVVVYAGTRSLILRVSRVFD